MVTSTSTIYALSTAQGRAAVAVIRLSGPRSKPILKRITRSDLPVPRTAALRRLYAPVVSTLGTPVEILDEALTLYFSAPRSFTGEDVVEFHVHGGRAVINAVMGAIRDYGREPNDQVQDGAEFLAPVRYAEPGEFTRRAFANMKIDLTQVEGIGGMIDAETETQRQMAVVSAGGYMRNLYKGWQAELLEISAVMSAIIDFSEEGYFDRSDSLFQDTVEQTKALIRPIQKHLQQTQRTEILLTGIKLALLGPPNAGKSSLLNHLAQRDAAIVSSMAGTTRDLIEVSLELGGYKVVLTDTAGLRPVGSVDDVEAQGIVRAKMKGSEANLVIAVIPAVVEDDAWHDVVRDEVLALQDDSSDKEVMVVLNKIDMLKSAETQIPVLVEQLSHEFNIATRNIYPISCKTGEGVSELTSSMVTKFENLADVSDSPVGASVRVQEVIQDDILPSLLRFLDHAEEEDVVFASEEIRYAAECIGRITGESIGVEDVLGVVFSRFCVGK
ncbi:P-loop containing nucleoside triphosphate hydrolase protein [Lipomyces arxii]|uniref:P-loop containing nucleoside triphosphate hydrolase protein n=1 Tax=Lipomyces arxii TaxID=56418 RepID=UPI0034CD0DD8